MQEQKRKSNFIKFKFKYFKKRLPKNLLRFRKLYSKSTNSFNLYFKRILHFFNTKNRYRIISIRLTQNNVFCTLTNNKNKIFTTSSSGKYKIKTSKKRIKFSSIIILKSFLKEIRKKILNGKILVNIISPKNLRKKIVRQIYDSMKKNRNFFINVENKKTFNGCRPKKQKRKKRKGLRIFQ